MLDESPIAINFSQHKELIENGKISFENFYSKTVIKCYDFLYFNLATINKRRKLLL